MNIVITGSDGFIGSKLLKKISSFNTHDVTGLDVRDIDLANKDQVLSCPKIKSADIIIVCHAINPTFNKSKISDSPFHSEDEESIMSQFKVNTLSLWYLCEALILSKEKKNITLPRLLFLSSVYAKRSPKHRLYEPKHKTPWYGATKCASDYLIKYLAAKYYGKVVLNSIFLGGIYSGRETAEFRKQYGLNSPYNDMQNAEEMINYISDVALLDSGSVASGSDYCADGGWLLW